MNYDEAKEIFMHHGCDYKFMAETGVVKKYLSYKVPKELENQWYQEYVENAKKRFIKKTEQGEVARVELISACRFQDGIGSNTLLDVFNAIQDNISKIDARTEASYYYVLAEALKIDRVAAKTDTEGFKLILKGGMERLAFIFKTNPQVQEEFQPVFDSFDELLEKYGLKYKE